MKHYVKYLVVHEYQEYPIMQAFHILILQMKIENVSVSGFVPSSDHAASRLNCHKGLQI
jgi:hypothetical protein